MKGIEYPNYYYFYSVMLGAVVDLQCRAHKLTITSASEGLVLECQTRLRLTNIQLSINPQPKKPTEKQCSNT